jgi:ribosome recycling factor
MASPVEFNWKITKKAGEEKMTKSVDTIQQQLNTIRASGASPSMLDRVFVDYFGTSTPLNQLARVSAQGSQQLVIEPFDKTATKDIEKAISQADLNLYPNNDGSGAIRINLPSLTEDRRKELSKQAKALCEEGKVAIRNVRREFVDKIKGAEKDKSIGKDDSKTYQDDLQKVTDDFIKKLDTMLKAKEKDLLRI